MSTIITEDSNTLVQETVVGLSGATSLNDTHVETIFSDPLTIDPLTNGWLIGSGWAWSAGNKNINYV